MLRAEKMRIQVKKKDSAMVYFILEASNGLTAYSTLPDVSNEPSSECTLELLFSPGRQPEVLSVVRDLEQQSLVQSILK